MSAMGPFIQRSKSWRTCATAAFLMVALMALASFDHARAAQDTEQFLGPYEELLKAHVRPVMQDEIPYAGVDYDAWASDMRHQNALELLLAAAPPNDAPESERKAYWINAYNFLTIDLIVREGERESIRKLGGLFSSPWTKFGWLIGGREYTLDFIEHDILRPLGDPRIHFAINCASVSCPDLRSEIYRADDLDNQLNDQVRGTLNNLGKGLWRDDGKLYVSKVFDWFSEDFNDGDVKGWLQQNANVTGQFSLRYLKYDWSLNKAN